MLLLAQEVQPLHFEVIFGRSMISCFGTLYGRYVHDMWLVHIYFQYTNVQSVMELGLEQNHLCPSNLSGHEF